MIELRVVEDNKPYFEKFKRLLTTYSGKDLQKACADWTIEILNEYRFKDLPPRTLEVADYEAMPLADRLDLDMDYFRKHPGIMAFYELCSCVRLHNREIRDWLTYCKQYVSEEDIQKINGKLDMATISMLYPKKEVSDGYREIGQYNEA